MQEHRNFAFHGNWTGNRMSSFTYSHRVKNSRTDSARFRLGTTSQFDRMYAAALPVLEARGIDLPQKLLAEAPKGSMRFYGLGWDHSKNHFKVYLMVHDLSAMPARYQHMLPETLDRDTRYLNFTESAFKEGSVRVLLTTSLLSFTFEGNRVVEEKVYVYPNSLEAAAAMGAKVPPAYVATAAVMFSSERGVVAQFDVDTHWSCVWRRSFNPVGAALVDRYHDVGLALETLTYSGSSDFTLYFPAGSG